MLGSLRDACRRFSIDTDRVFLTGHGIGGDAAWDIAIAHPDLWAGVIPIVAVADKFIGATPTNAKYVTWYVVGGELDGDKMARNAVELDRYMKPNTDVTVVEYQGRGYEPFGDEIQRMFDWMGLKQRKMPKEIECVSMRPGTTSSGGSKSKASRQSRWSPPPTGRLHEPLAGTSTFCMLPTKNTRRADS